MGCSVWLHIGINKVDQIGVISRPSLDSPLNNPVLAPILGAFGADLNLGASGNIGGLGVGAGANFGAAINVLQNIPNIVWRAIFLPRVLDNQDVTWTFNIEETSNITSVSFNCPFIGLRRLFSSQCYFQLDLSASGLPSTSLCGESSFVQDFNVTALSSFTLRLSPPAVWFYWGLGKGFFCILTTA